MKKTTISGFHNGLFCHCNFEEWTVLNHKPTLKKKLWTHFSNNIQSKRDFLLCNEWTIWNYNHKFPFHFPWFRICLVYISICYNIQLIIYLYLTYLRSNSRTSMIKIKFRQLIILIFDIAFQCSNVDKL